MKLRNGFRRLTAALIVLCLLPVQALAATDWNLYLDGSLSITENDSVYNVVSKDGDGQNVATQNTITVAQNVKTEIILNDVTVNAQGSAAIDVGENAQVTLEVNGENTVSSDSVSAIHFASGELAITSDSGGELNALGGGRDVPSGDYIIHTSCDAPLGSHMDEDMSGTIEISGDVTLNVGTNSGAGHRNAAGIGSGAYGDMSGSIRVTENASVNAVSDSGAAIGSGNWGHMPGSVTIGDQAAVNAQSNMWGAAIGSGANGTVDGSIVIEGQADVTADAVNQANGIGTGGNALLDGNIEIRDSAKVTVDGIGPNGASKVGENATYVFSTDALINGNSVAQGLPDEVMTTNKWSEHTVEVIIYDPTPESDEPATEGYVIWNDAGDISALLNGKPGPSEILEEAVPEESAKSLVGEKETVLRSASISFDKEHSGWFRLYFHLGAEHGNQQVEIRWLENGSIMSRSAVTDRDGTVSLSVTQTGSFAVIAK